MGTTRLSAVPLGGPAPPAGLAPPAGSAPLEAQSNSVLTAHTMAPPPCVHQGRIMDRMPQPSPFSPQALNAPLALTLAFLNLRPWPSSPATLHL